jgi:hypothetical protein
MRNAFAISLEPLASLGDGLLFLLRLRLVVDRGVVESGMTGSTIVSSKSTSAESCASGRESINSCACWRFSLTLLS